MESLPAYFYQPVITDFTTVNSCQYHRSCRYLSVYPGDTRDAIFKGHLASPCQNVEVIFLRGMPGQGKTHYCDTTIKAEHKLRQRHVKIISANLLAARTQAHNKGIQLTDEKLKEKNLKLSGQTAVEVRKWSELIFERSNGQGYRPALLYPANSSALVQTVLCEALASMRAEPVK